MSSSGDQTSTRQGLSGQVLNVEDSGYSAEELDEAFRQARQNQNTGSSQRSTRLSGQTTAQTWFYECKPWSKET
ncbi:uncharacterized protein I206_102627 [Kwoniella pini CBS 10737]|uniref:Uncharacterized protein n=1 Tax=Kwoniella pini CBS 10737 TaxID=1296096 RepID=A0AAJ8MPA2_9TREE